MVWSSLLVLWLSVTLWSTGMSTLASFLAGLLATCQERSTYHNWLTLAVSRRY